MYHALQDPKNSLSPEELAALDSEIQTLRNEIAAAKSEEKALKAELSTLNATVSTTELRASAAALEEEKAELVERLAGLKAGTTKAVSAEERAEAERSWKLWGYRASARKKACLELWGMVCEGLPDSKTGEELWVREGLPC